MANDSKPRKKSKGMKFITLPLIILAVWQMPYTFVLIVGLLPGLFSWLVDREKGKLTAVTVLALNSAALTPLLVRLWTQGSGMDDALKLMSNPINWVLILVGVAGGWILAQAVPSLVVSLIMARERARVSKMRERQQHLLEEWGNDLTEGLDAPSGHR